MGYGVFEWLFWVLAFLCAGAALYRAEKLSTGPVAGVRLKSGLLLTLWILAAVFGLAGFVTAILAMRAGAS